MTGGQSESTRLQLQTSANGNNPTHLECFMTYFRASLIQFIVDMTNKYAKESIPAGSRGRQLDITAEDLTAFFGLQIVMGIVRMPKLESYWLKKDWLLDYSAPNEIMSRDRFRFIYRYLHFCDETQVPSSDNPNRDRLYKIRPVLDKLLPRFEAVYSPGPNLSIDESLIPFNGRIRFLQFIPSKRARYGIKVWVLAESRTGYVCRLQFYTGRISGAQPELGLATNVVQSLIGPFTVLWHRLYVDNFYSSPDLFEQLLKMGVYACGTIRHTRRGFPKSLIVKKVTGKPGGFSDWRTSDPLLAQSWIDNRAVYFLSTMHKPECDPQYSGSKTVNRREGRGSAQKREVPCPPLLGDYNSNMGGVDLGDQMRKYYNLTRRCRSWCRRVFSYLLEISVLNARIIFEHTRGARVDGLEFRIELARQLIGAKRASRRPPVPPIAASKDARLENDRIHFPKNCGVSKNCVVCSKRDKEVPSAKKSFPSRSSIICRKCNVHLCVKQDSVCWDNWHSKQQFWR